MKANTEKTYVFIPGGWHGSWAFDPITEMLAKKHLNSLSLTLPGLEITANDPNRIINLDTHIQFVIDTLIKENLTNVILCGHSYAGLVITGVADKIPERLHALVYIDAYVPKDGDSCWSLTSEAYRQVFLAGAGNDGVNVAVPEGIESRRRPQSLATFIQHIHLTGNHELIDNRSFIYLSGWEGSPFKKQYENLKNDPNWNVRRVNCSHNIMREDPDELTKILIELQ